MTAKNLDEQLTKYLADVRSIEQQALTQMRIAPRIAGDEQIAQAFSDHLRETRDHKRLVAERLQARDAKPSPIKDVAGVVTGAGFALFAAAQPDTPGKLVVHAFSYEHMEEAAYDLLGQVAKRAGDDATVQVAGQIEAQERSMGERLAGLFDRAVDAALGDRDPGGISAQLDKYLADAHAIETQALQLLSKGVKLAGVADLASAFEEHATETREHLRLVEAALEAHGGKPNKLKDAALRLGAINWGAFFQAQPDTSAKLAAFAYAFEHLEIGAYESLKRVATRGHDTHIEQLADQILTQERAAAERVRSLLSQALDASLHKQGLAVG